MTRKNPQSTRDVQHKKPAEINLINGETILAPDHDINNSWCIVYKSTTTGIAKKIPRESILYIDREAGDTSINDGSSEPHDIDAIDDREYDTWWNGNEWRRVSTDDVTGEVALEREVKQLKLAPEEDVKPPYVDRTDDDSGDKDEDDEPLVVTDGGYAYPYLYDPWTGEDVGIGDMRDNAVENPPECDTDACDNNALPGKSECSECYVDPRVAAYQCSIGGCDGDTGHVRDTYCDKHLEAMRDEDDGVTPCENPRCDVLTQPGATLCGGEYFRVMDAARSRARGATWEKLRIGTDDRPTIEGIVAELEGDEK